ncbi:MAG TPA: hypothetical protein VD930_10295 [Gemmatimonadales bacterium]|nr:hypothetical protein [Gemmatimonadales bacterium]
MRRARRARWLAGTIVLAACERDQHRSADAAASPSWPAATAATDLKASRWRIAPNHFGPIHPETSEADLQRTFGDSVVRVRVELGEGETTPGTVLFPGDSIRRAEIIWRDTLHFRRPERAVLRGTRSVWQAAHGISLGTTLRQLEQLNGKPFTLAGFGWDYAGVITDWQGGALDSALAGIKLYVIPDPAKQQSAAYARVLGDRDYSSALEAMQQLNPRVEQIFVDFQSHD